MRWRAMDEAPQHLHLGLRGLRTADAAWPEGGRVDELPVEFRNGTAYVLSPRGIGRGDAARKSALLEFRLSPNAIFLASDAGGGWVGSDRYVLGVFPVSALGSKVYEADGGRFFLETKGRRTAGNVAKGLIRSWKRRYWQRDGGADSHWRSANSGGSVATSARDERTVPWTWICGSTSASPTPTIRS